MIFQKGIITEVNERDYTAKVRLVDMQEIETDFLPIVTPVGIGNKHYNLLKQDSLVICLIQHQGQEGVILGSLYNDIDQPPANQQHIFKQEFEDGSFIQYDNLTGDLEIQTTKNINLKANTQVNINANVSIKGSLDVLNNISTKAMIDAVGTINSKATMNANDFVAGITTLKTHAHMGNSGAPTSPPIV